MMDITVNSDLLHLLHSYKKDLILRLTEKTMSATNNVFDKIFHK